MKSSSVLARFVKKISLFYMLFGQILVVLGCFHENPKSFRAFSQTSLAFARGIHENVASFYIFFVKGSRIYTIFVFLHVFIKILSVFISFCKKL